MSQDSVGRNSIPTSLSGPCPPSRLARASLCVATVVAFALGVIFPAFAQPGADPGASETLQGELRALLAMDQAVAAIALRLSTANAALCPRNAPQAGVVIHSLAQYGRRLRATAAASLELDGRPTIETVVPGGPADVAGFRAGDVLFAISGTPITSLASGVDPTSSTGRYAAVRRAIDQLNSALRSGPAKVRVLRRGEPVDLTLIPVTGCDISVEVSPSQSLDASADDTHVFISTALVEYAPSAGELATVIGHEMAHTILRTRRLALGKPAEHAGGLGAARREESDADEIGLYLMARAGYDISAGPGFGRRFGRDHPFQTILALSHPDAAARARALERDRLEILRPERQGEPLIPPQLRAPLALTCAHVWAQPAHSLPTNAGGNCLANAH